ncbi:MAG: phospholipase A [Sporocytophaga sp.]|nr:phospholipase A [Sporocytophaga sp.]
MKHLLIGLLVMAWELLISPGKLSGQQLSQDSLNKLIDQAPSFTIFRENYFTTGVPFNEKPSRYNSDIKFQISFKQRLTKTVLPFNTYLYLIYTQKTFWEVYRKSSPFRDSNYNPGFGLGKFLFKDNIQYALVSLTAEHESNGQDSIYSRSWNFVSLSYMLFFKNKRLLIRAWYPFGYEDNASLLDYIGYGELNFFWDLRQQRLKLNITARKGASIDLKGSIQIGLFYRLFKFSNQYLYLQVYEGYAENLLYYNELTSKIRLGWAITPAKLIID